MRHVNDIAQGRAGGRGHHAHAARVFGQGPFECRVEQSFGGELAFEGVKGDLQGAFAEGFDGADHQLALAAGFVEGGVGLEEDLAAVLEERAGGAGVVAETDALHLGGGVFEREIDMTRTLGAQVADLARDPHPADVFFQKPFEGRGQLRDGPDAAGLRRGKQLAELPLGFSLGHGGN